MSSKQPVGPRPIVRADGSTSLSTGAVHTLAIRFADWLRTRNTPSTDPVPTLPADLVIADRAAVNTRQNDFEARWLEHVAVNRISNAPR